MVRRVASTRVAAAVAMVLMSVSGCSHLMPVVDKSGGGSQQVRLSFALGSGAPPPELAYFASQLADLSNRQIGIDYRPDYGGYQPDTEVRTVRDVAAGTVDMGWAATRAFDTLGMASMAAVSAPMLLSNDAAGQVFLDSDVPARLLHDAQQEGIHPLGLMWDGDSVPITVHKPLRRPKDWRGLAIGTWTSPTQERTIRALGAKPVRAFGVYRDRALQLGTMDGFAMGLRALAFNKLAARAPLVTYNVGLWPVVEVLMMNPHSYAKLSPVQRRWVDDAATAASRASVARAAPTQADVRLSCRLGAHFVAASPADLRAMRRAVDPVYTHLKANPDSRQVLADLTTALESHAGRAPTIPTPIGCAPR
jgi:TRAP-type transport system periplasmic protein